MEKNILLKISEILKKYRKDNSLTQEKLAIKMNLAVSTIKKKESGRYNFTENFLETFISLKGIGKEDREYIKMILKSLKKKDSRVGDSDAELIKKMASKIEKLERELKLKNALLKPKKNSSYEEKLRNNAFVSDFDTTTRLVPLIWELRDNSFKTYSEIELLLEINDPNRNKKIKKGLTKVAKDMVKMGEGLLSYVDDDSEVIDI